MRDTRDHEPCVIDGAVCADTLKRLGYPRQAEWCREADRRRARTCADYDRVSKERDELWQRLQKYEAATPQQATPVTWTGD